MTLSSMKPGNDRTIRAVTGTEKIRSFLLSLGCYEGQPIRLVSILAGNYIVEIRNSRFALDRGMASAILLN